MDLTGPVPETSFPFGMPGPLADLVGMLGAELDCLLAPMLPKTAPNFAVFIEVRNACSAQHDVSAAAAASGMPVTCVLHRCLSAQ